jgi:hypothetical protein
MYIPRNWEFGSALAKLRIFGGRLGVKTLKHPLGGNIDWMVLADDRDNWWAVVSKVMKMWVCRKCGKLLDQLRN